MGVVPHSVSLVHVCTCDGLDFLSCFPYLAQSQNAKPQKWNRKLLRLSSETCADVTTIVTLFSMSGVLLWNRITKTCDFFFSFTKWILLTLSILVSQFSIEILFWPSLKNYETQINLNKSLLNVAQVKITSQFVIFLGGRPRGRMTIKCFLIFW